MQTLRQFASTSLTHPFIHIDSHQTMSVLTSQQLSSFSSFLGISRRALHNAVFDSHHHLRHQLVLPSGHVRVVEIGEKFMKIPSEAARYWKLIFRFDFHFEPVLMISAEFQDLWIPIAGIPSHSSTFISAALNLDCM